MIENPFLESHEVVRQGTNTLLQLAEGATIKTMQTKLSFLTQELTTVHHRTDHANTVQIHPQSTF